MSLEELAQRHGTDKFQHGYCPYYEHHLGELQTSAVNLLEIGVSEGCSVKMWREWFPVGNIFGIDIAPMVHLGLEGIATTMVDVKDYVPDRNFDIIIDDGSHWDHDIAVAVQRLWRNVKPGGWYVIEDLATQYNQGWVTDLNDGSEALRAIHSALDDTFTKGEVSEFHAYEEIVFLRKRA
jgi:trans-aconitate methyltransferase